MEAHTGKFPFQGLTDSKWFGPWGLNPGSHPRICALTPQDCPGLLPQDSPSLTVPHPSCTAGPVLPAHPPHGTCPPTCLLLGREVSLFVSKANPSPSFRTYSPCSLRYSIFHQYLHMILYVTHEFESITIFVIYLIFLMTKDYSIMWQY